MLGIYFFGYIFDLMGHILLEDKNLIDLIIDTLKD